MTNDPDFIDWITARQSSRPEMAFEDIINSAGGASKIAIVAVDLLEGFCRQGPLASESVGALIEPVVQLLREAHRTGVTKFYFPSDAHQENSPEFQAFPPHCVSGTKESELVSEVRELPFADLFRRVDKGSVSSLIGTDLARSLQDDEVKAIICVGDCTDLCLYHLAVGLRFWANTHHLGWRIVVPQNLVATYDLPTATAREIGAMPHPADFMNTVFFYHLELNGVEVVSLD